MIMNNFLRINNKTISLTKAITYLQGSGKLGDFVNEIIHQYVLEQELAQVEIPADALKQTIDNFRQSNQLTPEQFQQWLTQQNQNLETFQQQITQSIKLQELIFQVTESKISEYFIKHKLLLDSFILSRLIVQEQELAEELKSQITEEGESFERLAQEYSLTEDRLFNGMLGAVSRGQLPDNLRAAIDKVGAGEIVGPMEIENHWCLFRVEQILPASLADEQLKEKLRKEIFEDWITAKMQKLEIEMNLIN